MESNVLILLVDGERGIKFESYETMVRFRGEFVACLDYDVFH